MALRKNQRNLTDWEKTQFTDAVLKLKAEKTGTTNTYDKYVQWHIDYTDATHAGPAFFAWHREFLRRFEIELQRIMKDDTLGLPYWDWSVDQAPPSWPFTKEFLGGNGTSDARFPGKVVDGPFAFDDPNNWTLHVFDPDDPDPYARYPYLRRQFGPGPGNPKSSLPTPANVQATFKATPYDVDPWNENSASGFRNMAEGNIPEPRPQMHNRIHHWVGGSMVPPTSPNDPVFWLHHCYVDKLWADWQRLHKDDVGYQPYVPEKDARTGHNLTDRMAPWHQKRPLDVLNTWDLGYHYDNDNYLMPNDVLYPGQSIATPIVNGRRFSLTYSSSDGNNLVLGSNQVAWALWLSTNQALPDGWCVMQTDGNLVIYDWSNKPLWPSNTNYGYWIYLTVEDATEKRSGHLQMYRWDDQTPIDWSVPPPKVGNSAKG